MFYDKVWTHQGYDLVRRPDTPNYYIYYRLPGRPTRRISTGTSDRDEAERRLIALAERRRVPRKAAPSEVGLDEVLRAYVATRLEGKSRRDAESVLKQWRTFMADEDVRTVAEMPLAMQRRYIEWRKRSKGRRGRELSRGTINKDLEVLRAALNHARQEGFVSDVPHVRLLPRPPRRERFLTTDEVQRLLAECHEPHLRRFVMIALHTLQRPGAILGLRCDQVDLARGRIDFRSTDTGQTNKRRAVVPITKTLRPVLDTALQESVNGYVIEYIGRPVKSIKGAFRRACERAGLDGVMIYTLRHTGATLLAGAGVPLWQVSGLLGHSISQTTEIYAKHAPEFLAEAANGLDAVMSGCDPGGAGRANRAPEDVAA